MSINRVSFLLNYGYGTYMKIFTLTVILLSSFYFLSAQDDSPTLLLSNGEKRFRIYKIWVSLNNDPKILNGVLYKIKDSSILVSNSIIKEDYTTGRFELSKINYQNIDIVKIRVKNSVGIGILKGAVAGFAIGALIGILSGDDNPDEIYFASTAERKAVVDGIILSLIGGNIGAMVGNIKVKIPINGDMGNFNRNRIRLNKYTIR